MLNAITPQRHLEQSKASGDGGGGGGGSGSIDNREKTCRTEPPSRLLLVKPNSSPSPMTPATASSSSSTSSSSPSSSSSLSSSSSSSSSCSSSNLGKQQEGSPLPNNAASSSPNGAEIRNENYDKPSVVRETNHAQRSTKRLPDVGNSGESVINSTINSKIVADSSSAKSKPLTTIPIKISNNNNNYNVIHQTNQTGNESMNSNGSKLRHNLQQQQQHTKRSMASASDRASATTTGAYNRDGYHPVTSHNATSSKYNHQSNQYHNQRTSNRGHNLNSHQNHNHHHHNNNQLQNQNHVLHYQNQHNHQHNSQHYHNNYHQQHGKPSSSNHLHSSHNSNHQNNSSFAQATGGNNYGSNGNHQSSSFTSSSTSLHGSDVASSSSSMLAHRASGGPPHYVDLHVNAGECVSLQMLDGQEQVVAGPTTITMVSQQQNPPVPIPVQVPPGHMIHQIADENGTLKHIILSVMDMNDDNRGGQHIDPSMISIPHPSFNTESLGDLVQNLTPTSYVQEDNSYEHLEKPNLTAPAVVADRKDDNQSSGNPVMVTDATTSSSGKGQEVNNGVDDNNIASANHDGCQKVVTETVATTVKDNEFPAGEKDKGNLRPIICHSQAVESQNSDRALDSSPAGVTPKETYRDLKEDESSQDERQKTGDDSLDEKQQTKSIAVQQTTIDKNTGDGMEMKEEIKESRDNEQTSSNLEDGHVIRSEDSKIRELNNELKGQGAGEERGDGAADSKEKQSPIICDQMTYHANSDNEQHEVVGDTYSNEGLNQLEQQQQQQEIYAPQNDPTGGALAVGYGDPNQVHHHELISAASAAATVSHNQLITPQMVDGHTALYGYPSAAQQPYCCCCYGDPDGSTATIVAGHPDQPQAHAAVQQLAPVSHADMSMMHEHHHGQQDVIMMQPPMGMEHTHGQANAVSTGANADMIQATPYSAHHHHQQALLGPAQHHVHPLPQPMYPMHHNQLAMTSPHNELQAPAPVSVNNHQQQQHDRIIQNGSRVHKHRGTTSSSANPYTKRLQNDRHFANSARHQHHGQGPYSNFTHHASESVSHKLNTSPGQLASSGSSGNQHSGYPSGNLSRSHQGLARGAPFLVQQTSTSNSSASVSSGGSNSHLKGRQDKINRFNQQNVPPLQRQILASHAHQYHANGSLSPMRSGGPNVPAYAQAAHRGTSSNKSLHHNNYNDHHHNYQPHSAVPLGDNHRSSSYHGNMNTLQQQNMHPNMTNQKSSGGESFVSNVDHTGNYHKQAQSKNQSLNVPGTLDQHGLHGSAQAQPMNQDHHRSHIDKQQNNMGNNNAGVRSSQRSGSTNRAHSAVQQKLSVSPSFSSSAAPSLAAQSKVLPQSGAISGHKQHGPVAQVSGAGPEDLRNSPLTRDGSSQQRLGSRQMQSSSKSPLPRGQKHEASMTVASSSPAASVRVSRGKQKRSNNRSEFSQQVSVSKQANDQTEAKAVSQATQIQEYDKNSKQKGSSNQRDSQQQSSKKDSIDQTNQKSSLSQTNRTKHTAKQEENVSKDPSSSSPSMSMSNKSMESPTNDGATVELAVSDVQKASKNHNQQRLEGPSKSQASDVENAHVKAHQSNHQRTQHMGNADKFEVVVDKKPNAVPPSNPSGKKSVKNQQSPKSSPKTTISEVGPDHCPQDESTNSSPLHAKRQATNDRSGENDPKSSRRQSGLDQEAGEEILSVRADHTGACQEISMKQASSNNVSASMRTSLSESNIQSLSHVIGNNRSIVEAKSTQTSPQKPALAERTADTSGSCEAISDKCQDLVQPDQTHISTAGNKKKTSEGSKNKSSSKLHQNGTHNKSEQQFRLNSLPQIKLFNLNCVSVNSSSVNLRWSYIPAVADKHGINHHFNHHHSRHSSHYIDHFVIESSNQKNVESNTLVGPKVSYQGSSMSCRVNNLSPEKIYHFRVRRTALITCLESGDDDDPLATEHLGVSDILSVTLPSVQQQKQQSGGPNHQQSTSSQHQQQLSSTSSSRQSKLNSQNHGDKFETNNLVSSLTIATNSSTTTNNSLQSGNTSSHNHQQHISNHNGHNSHKHQQQHVKLSTMIKQCRNRLFSGLGKMVRKSFSSCSDTKFASLIILVFTVFAVLLAYFIHLYLVAHVTD